MSRVEHIENQIRQLSPEELCMFRDWFASYDAVMWDQRFERDVEAGKLDELAERALLDHKADKSTKL